MQKRSFGRTKEGREVTEYTLVNAQGMTLSVIDLGATIVSITMKGSDGNVYDVVLGYDTPVDYQNNTCYFGAVIGRNANRIDHAHIHLDGKDYSLEANDNENNLHSGSHGFHAVIWDVVQESAQSITFSYVSRDGEQDFPMIIAPINRVAGRDVRALPYMHWWTFIGYYMEIGDCTFSTILDIRRKLRKHKKLEKWEREYYDENRELIDFKSAHLTDDEDEFIRQLMTGGVRDG